MNERLEAMRKAAEQIIQVRRGYAVNNIDIERAHAFFDEQVRQAPPPPPPQPPVAQAWANGVGQKRHELPAIDITEEEYIAMYRSQDPDYAEPKQVMIGDTIMMPSGVRYRVNLPPKRIPDEPIPF